MAQVEVITGADRRRSFTLEEKQRLLAEAFSPGVNVKAFCRRRDIASSSLYTWRRELARLATPATGSGLPVFPSPCRSPSIKGRKHVRFRLACVNNLNCPRSLRNHCPH